MLAEKEFHIIKASVEEEIEYVRRSDYLNSRILTSYFFSLVGILEKLGKDMAGRQDISNELAVQ